MIEPDLRFRIERYIEALFVAPRGVTVAPSEEVAEAFWVPLPLLAHPSATGEATFTDRGVDRPQHSLGGGRRGEHVPVVLTE